MVLHDLHLRALGTGQDCSALGAHPRTIAVMTGLSSQEISQYFFPDPATSRRGRPPDSTNWYFMSTLSQRVEACVVIGQYARLRRHGFLPAESLIAAYRHYLGVCQEPRLLSFDRAFDIASQLDGIWGATLPTLKLLSCSTCRSEVLAELGEVSISECPFCRLIRRVELGLAESPPVAGTQPAPPPRNDPFRNLRVARECVALGAKLRTIHLLTGFDFPELAQTFFDGREQRPRGRPAHSLGWYEITTIANRCQACALVSQFKRLTDGGIDPVDALLAAYKHFISIFRGDDVLPFDRAFELAGHLAGRWLCRDPVIMVYRCDRCGCECLTPLNRKRTLACPFCRLWTRDQAPDSQFHLEAPARP